jgi:phytoene dehydrogenase-like protein
MEPIGDQSEKLDPNVAEAMAAGGADPDHAPQIGAQRERVNPDVAEVIAGAAAQDQPTVAQTSGPIGAQRERVNPDVAEVIAAGSTSGAARVASGDTPSALIVGAGLGGLVCARHLVRNGFDVTVLEASDDAGGRVRSDHQDGFILDRGFQVLFDAYPAVRRNLDLEALRLQPFDPGAIICLDGSRTVLTDPLRDRNWRDLLEAVRSGAVSPDDKLRTLKLALSARDGEADQSIEPDDQSTLSYLRSLRFGDDIIDRFFRPFYGGIFLDRDLGTTAAAFRFYFRMLSLGKTALPAHGIGAITQQLAAPLRAGGRLRLNTRVAALLSERGRIVGVRLADGGELRADAVVLATDAPSAARLQPEGVTLSAPADTLGVTAIYFAGAQPLTKSRKIVLNAAPDALVNNAQMLSNIAASYAPPGRHLLSATVLGAPELEDGALAAAALDDLRRMFSGNQRALAALESYAPLRVYRIPDAQFAQPPGVYRNLPGNRTRQPGLYIAAEWTESSSINGAMTSGERCAAAVNQEIRRAQRSA